jgi:plastocyanin
MSAPMHRWACLPLLLLGCDPGGYVPEPGDEAEAHPEEPAAADAIDAGQLPPEPDATPTVDVIPGTLAVALTPASANLVLGETKTFVVSLTSENGFAGGVTLQAQGLPPSWIATFTPATATLTAGGTATVELRLDVPTTAEARLAPVTIAAADGTGAGGVMPLMVEVAPEVVIKIPAGALNLGAAAFGSAPTQVRYLAPGTKVTWRNDDTIPHRIHGPNQDGFAHQPDPLPAGGTYSVTITKARSFDYFCHTHPSMKGKLEVLLPPAQ